MAPRQITGWIAQRVAMTAVIGAFALGLAAPMFTPSGALAAPAPVTATSDIPGLSTEIAYSGTLGQMPDERLLAEELAQSLTGDLADYLTKSAWVVDKDDFFRVVLPLKGRPENANAQFPPPSEDTLAWIDLYRYDDPAAAPTGLERWRRQGMQDDEKFILEFRPDDPVYVIERGGFQWYTLGGHTVRALDEICGLTSPDRR
jgi:hypothetical protein